MAAGGRVEPTTSPARPGRFERYVAIGDSSTEGLIDPDGQGGYRGWSMRLAERIAEVQEIGRAHV